MALSDEQISALYFDALGSQHLREQDRKMVTRFAHAVESEVRKQDEALIRQMNEALALARRLVLVGGAATHDEIDTMFTAASAARARLEGKP